MNLDWITILAQVVNFLILVALLRHFLYGRILRIIDDREATIAERLSKADRIQKEAEREAERFRNQSREIQCHREALLNQAAEEAETWRRDQLDRTKLEIGQKKLAWENALQQDHQIFLQELRKRLVEGTCKLTRKVLTDLADSDLESRVVAVLIDRLETLPSGEIAAFHKAMQSAHGQVEVITAFPLKTAHQESIQKALQKLLPDVRQVAFQTNPKLTLGIELNAFDRKLAWTLEAYLEPLEEDLAGFIQTRALPSPGTANET